MPFAATWMLLEILIPSKSERKRQKPNDIAYMWNLKYGKMGERSRWQRSKTLCSSSPTNTSKKPTSTCRMIHTKQYDINTHKKHIDQRNRIESPGQLIYNKGGKNIQQRKDSSQ